MVPKNRSPILRLVFQDQIADHLDRLRLKKEWVNRIIRRTFQSEQGKEDNAYAALRCLARRTETTLLNGQVKSQRHSTLRAQYKPRKECK